MIREVNRAGLELIKAFEGVEDGDPSTVNLDPYLDPVNIWTIGWGHAIRVDGRFLRGERDRDRAMAMYPGGLTVSQAEQLLRADALDACRDVSAAVHVPLTDNQYAALVSWHFNTGAIASATLTRLLNAGDYAGAAEQLPRWNRAGGKVLNGLTRRRHAERDLFRAA